MENKKGYIELKSGVKKNGKKWFVLVVRNYFESGKFFQQHLFISEETYNYLLSREDLL